MPDAKTPLERTKHWLESEVTRLRGELAALTAQPVCEGDPHTYTSTACHHGLHDRCRKQCKFCAVSCACRCHLPAEAV